MTEEQLRADLQSAMRARDMQRVYVLRGLIASIKTLKVEKQVQELAEAELLGLVRKELNQRLEAIAFAEKLGRADLVEQNRTEQRVIEEYLPKQLDAGQLEQAIRDLAAELATTQIGTLMSELRKRYPGQFDGKLASEIVRRQAAGGGG